MGQNRDTKLEINNCDLPWKLVSRAWPRGRVKCIEAGEYVGFALDLDSVELIRELPVNFFSTELMAVRNDRDNFFNDLSFFMEQWGFPYALDRYVSPWDVEMGEDEDWYSEHSERDIAGTRITEYFYEHSKEIGFYPKNYDINKTPYISLREAAHAITSLQGIVNVIINGLRNTNNVQKKGYETADYNGSRFDLILLNDAASSHKALSFKSKEFGFKHELDFLTAEYPNDRGLTSAIATQIVETLADAAPWYQCKAPDCGRFFKYKRATGAPRTNSEYCSETCANRVHVRKHRERKKQAESNAKRKRNPSTRHLTRRKA
jgi:hypothetical protein